MVRYRQGLRGEYVISNYPGKEMSFELNEDFIGQNLEKQSWFSTKHFLKISKYMLILKGVCKKIEKKTGRHTPVPGP